jgi:signal transduction histidine kinase
VGVTSVLHEREQQRVAALHEYGLLDAPAGDELDAVVRVAAHVAGVPTATLNLIDEQRQCQLTTVGFDGADSPRSDSMCAIQFETGRFVHVTDASRDPVYRDNPWVTGLMADVRFYASAPLVTPQGHALGTLCVFDSAPRTLSAGQIDRLQDLAGIILALFERRRQARLHAQLAAEAERRKRFTDTVLDTIDVAVVAADPTGHLTLFNRAARDWHGVDADPAVDPVDLPERYALLDADTGAPIAADQVPVLRALRDGVVTGAEMLIGRRGRDPLHVTVNGRNLLADDGSVIGAVVAMNDVTTDRAQRRALERAHAELATRGGQLAATIAELERSNTELTHFAGTVSHDLAAPLAAIRGYLDLLDDMYADQLDAQARKWIATATTSVTRMHALIQALLTYATAGSAPLHRHPADLGDVLGHVLIDLRTAIREAQAAVTVTGELPTAACDPTLVRQLLQNLIGNALKYRHPDRPSRITISAHTDGTGTVTVTVADNGVGVPPEHRRAIFDMFTRVDAAPGTGQGIGLATCHRIVGRHGGRIWAEETDGGGTTIRFTIPAAPPPEPLTAVPDAAAVP